VPGSNRCSFLLQTIPYDSKLDTRGSPLDIKLVETGVPLIYIGEGEGGATGSKEFWQRGDFSFKKLPCSTWNLARTDTPTGIAKEKIRHHTATWLVKKRKKKLL